MQRRAFLGALASASAAAQSRPYDLLIRNGELRDPSRNIRRKADLGIANGKIVAIEDSLPSARAVDTIDATGRMVCPGLVDLHTHCYFGASSLGIDPNPVGARTGVTTWVDAGTFSHDQAGGFRKYIVEPARVRVFGFVYLYPSDRNPDNDVLKYVRSHMKPTAEVVAAHRDILLGVKIQVGSNMSGKYSPELFKIARELCDTYRLPMMAHISFAPPSTDEVMDQMRAGDIVTHSYNRHTLGILDEKGKVRASVRRARERGVWFDIGHGNGSFNFEAARKAIDDGFVADTISTDIYNLNINGPVYDMPTTMSKLLYLGWSFDDVLLRSTANPGRIVNRIPMLGTLQTGAPADISILSLQEGEFPLIDSQKNTVKAKQRIVCHAAICKGVRL